MDVIPFQIDLGIISGRVGDHLEAGIISGPVWESFRCWESFWGRDRFVARIVSGPDRLKRSEGP